MGTRVAVVTGGNKGIGYEIVKGLLPLFDGIVYLTARNEELGLKAVSKLENENIKKVYFHQLDIENQESINRFASYIKEKHGGLDIIINNAGVNNKTQDAEKFAQLNKDTIRTNYTSTRNFSNALFPLLRPHARVVNVASRLGLLKYLLDNSMRARLASPDLTVEEIDTFIQKYHKALDDGEHTKFVNNGYDGYTFSKIMLISLTRLQQRQFDRDSRPDLVVSAMCPGYCATDMTNHAGHLTAEQGAQTAIYAALFPANYNGPKGAFFAEKNVVDWEMN